MKENTMKLYLLLTVALSAPAGLLAMSSSQGALSQSVDANTVRDSKGLNVYDPSKLESLQLFLIRLTRKPEKIIQESFKNTLSATDGSSESSKLLSESFIAAANDTLLNPYLIIPDVNARDRIFGMTAFAWAAAQGNLDLAKQLVRYHKVGIHIADRYGDTPLHHAVRNGHIPMVTFILELAGGLTLTNNKNQTPADIAFDTNQSEDMIRCLLA